MINYREVYDISLLLDEASVNYPGDTPFSMDFIGNIGKGFPCNLSRLTMSGHSGTHIDMPAHFRADGKTIDQYKVKEFILPALLAEVRGREEITADDLEHLDVQPGSGLLLKTDNSVDGLAESGRFSNLPVYLSADAADFCVRRKVKLLGIDYMTPEKAGDDDFPVHHRLLEHDIFILEGLVFRGVPAGIYTLLCLPLYIKGGEASPVRAVLLQ
jgi:arylformamidase